MSRPRDDTWKAPHGRAISGRAVRWRLCLVGGYEHQGAVAIPGTKRRRYLEENIAAAEVTLTAEDTAAIEAAAPQHAGGRYAPGMMGWFDG